MAGVNENHQRLCPSPEWAAYLEEEILPQVAGSVDLGEDMLEIGPGPGASTGWLRQQVRRLVAVELDEVAAEGLRERFAGSNVEVVVGDGTRTGLPSGSFDSVGTFTMLHHLPRLEAQQALVAEAFRVLRPGGVLVGSDSLASTDLHEFHAGDTYNPVDPALLVVMLRAAGFPTLTVTVGATLTFVARKEQRS